MANSRQLPWLANRNISTRFRLISLIQLTAVSIIILALIVSVPLILNQLEELNQAQYNLNVAGQIEGDLLRSREHEQDFFLQTNLTLGESNINYIQYTNQIRNVDSALNNLSPQYQTETQQIQDGIQVYDSNFREIVVTHIPARQQTIDEISVLLANMNRVATFQSSAIVISSLRNLENQLIIYQLQISPNRNNYDEFQITQLNRSTEIQQAYRNLTTAIEISTLTQPVKDELTLLTNDIITHFDTLKSIDSTISEQIRTFKDAIANSMSLITDLITESNNTFENESATFIGLLQSRLLLIIGAVVISSGIILFLIPFITRSIQTPIHLLAEATTDVASGNYDRRIIYQSDDELGQLAISFNRMGEAIQQRNIQLNQALEEAHEANRLKDEFLATMSHELRTPLNAIIGFLGIISMTAKLDDKNQHRVERATLNSERLLGLINNILDISRIEAGRMKITKSAVNIRDLAGELQSQLDILVDVKDVDFILEIDDNLPEQIWTDEDVVTKIITNLAGNAMKFTSEGEVRVSIHAQEDQASWSIRVSDTGIGIPIHMQETIFDRFRQVDGSSTREYGGSGLGLAIVSGLCREMDGTVTVESDVGQGSTFMITLPLEQPLMVG